MNIIKDYKTLVIDPQREFMKLHWKGYTLITVGAYVVGAGVGYLYLKNQERKHKALFKDM